MDSSVLCSLAGAFFAHKGKLIDKWEQYIGAYQIELAGLRERGQPVALAEIGVQNGGSLEFWVAVLPPGSTVTGLDIDPRVGDLVFDSPAIRTHILDAGDPVAVETALGDASFDVVIDDGSHLCADVLANLRLFYPRLRPGGIMFIEDLHTSYSPTHGGSYGGADTSVEYLKRIIDLLHADHFPPEHGDRLEAALPTAMRATLGSITFYDSLAVLHKMETRKEQPWRRIISGETAQVVPFSSWIRHSSASLLSGIAFGDVAARSFETALADAGERHTSNEHLVEAARERRTALKAALADVAGDIARLEEEIAASQPEIALALAPRLKSVRRTLEELSGEGETF